MILLRSERMHQSIEGPRRERVKGEALKVIQKIDGNPMLLARFGLIRAAMADICKRQVANASGVQLRLLEVRVHSCHTTIQGAESFFRRQMP